MGWYLMFSSWLKTRSLFFVIKNNDPYEKINNVKPHKQKECASADWQNPPDCVIRLPRNDCCVARNRVTTHFFQRWRREKKYQKILIIENQLNQLKLSENLIISKYCHTLSERPQRCACVEHIKKESMRNLGNTFPKYMACKNLPLKKYGLPISWHFKFILEKRWILAYHFERDNNGMWEKNWNDL